MSKKIAFVLILVLLSNMVVWAEAEDGGLSEETEGILWGIVGGLLFIAIIIAIAFPSYAEADAPDDGIRLSSMQSELNDRITSSPVLNLLQHVNFGYSAKNDKVFAGFRFQF
ncbi:hypothetical protein [Treponema sp. R80B11-R83G3]